MITSLTADERETTLTVADGGDFVRIDTTRRKDITALRKRANVVEVEFGFHGTTEWNYLRLSGEEDLASVDRDSSWELSPPERRRGQRAAELANAQGIISA